MYLYEDLLGFRANHKCKFQGQDSESLFMKNKAQMPDDWLYNTETISYDYNRLGHRCKNPEDIDFSNYCLFLGDSHTEGIGLAIEKTYPYITAEKLNMDYYNLGLGGTGIDYTFYNLNIWLTKFQRPNYVVIYYSDPSRYVTQYDSNNNDEYDECGSWDNDEYRKDLLIAGTETNYFLTRYKLYVNMIYNLMKYHNLKYSNISFVLDKLYFMDIKVIEKGKDYARDQLHSGNITHQSISDYLISDYTDKYKNATIYSTFRGKSV